MMWDFTSKYEVDSNPSNEFDIAVDNLLPRYYDSDIYGA